MEQFPEDLFFRLLPPGQPQRGADEEVGRRGQVGTDFRDGVGREGAAVGEEGGSERGHGWTLGARGAVIVPAAGGRLRRLGNI